MIRVERFENPIVGNDYAELVDAMKACAECGNLPQTLEIKNLLGITFEDVRSLIAKFKKDTFLEMVFSAELCPYCDKLHAFLHVGYPEEDDILQ